MATEGGRHRTMRVAATRRVADGIVHARLESPDGAPLPEWQPGRPRSAVSPGRPTESPGCEGLRRRTSTEVRHRGLQGPQHRRARLQQAQGLPRDRPPDRQTRVRLPRHPRRRLDQDLAPRPRRPRSVRHGLEPKPSEAGEAGHGVGSLAGLRAGPGADRRAGRHRREPADGRHRRSSSGLQPSVRLGGYPAGLPLWDSSEFHRGSGISNPGGLPHTLRWVTSCAGRRAATPHRPVG